MNIQYAEPLSAAWKRMKKALFQPFDLAKWFTVGFTAFLAGLLDGGSGGGNSNIGKRSHADLDDLFNFPGVAWEWLNSNPVWFTLIVVALAILFIVGVILTWLSSRGKFMFLDNVVHDRAEVKKPWYEYTREGNSLFLWRLVYGLLVFAVVIVSLVYAFESARTMYYGHLSWRGQVIGIFGTIAYFLLLFIITGYISLFLSDFVVPIMYRNRIGAMRAWSVFLKLFSRHAGHFLLYGIFIFLLIILVVIAVILFGFLTCCIGFLLLIIPYIRSVVFLPVSYTFRAFSLEYLEQFGEDYAIFPGKEVAPDELVVE